MRLKSHRATFKQTKPNTSTVEKLTRLDSLLPYQQAKLVNVALIYCHTSMFTCTCALMCARPWNRAEAGRSLHPSPPPQYKNRNIHIPPCRCRRRRCCCCPRAVGRTLTSSSSVPCPSPACPCPRPFPSCSRPPGRRPSPSPCP